MARNPDRANEGGGPRARRLSDVAYGEILENLFRGRLPAGAFVSQNDLVALLGIPVAPLRDALRVLEAEGILSIHPRSGIQFVKPGLELTRSAYQFRAIIERAAVRIFAETAPAEWFDVLADEHRALIARLVGAEIDPDAQAELERLEGRLHNSIVGIMANPLIEFELPQDSPLPPPGPARPPPHDTGGAAVAARAHPDHRRLHRAGCRSSRSRAACAFPGGTPATPGRSLRLRQGSPGRTGAGPADWRSTMCDAT